MTPAPETQLKILIVEDDPNMRRLVAAYLESEGYDVSQAPDGPSGLTEADKTNPDLIILDLMLPELGGLEVAERLRGKRETPILILTALGEEDDVLQGFAAGADDYLTKPFNPKELVARVRAILRRSGVEEPSEEQRFEQDGLALDHRSREAWVDGKSVELTAAEFELLAALTEHPGWVYTREELLEKITGFTYLGDSRVIDVHVANLRKKIEPDPTNPTYVLTVRKVGYRFKGRG